MKGGFKFLTKVLISTSVNFVENIILCRLNEQIFIKFFMTTTDSENIMTDDILPMNDESVPETTLKV